MFPLFNASQNPGCSTLYSVKDNTSEKTLHVFAIKRNVIVESLQDAIISRITHKWLQGTFNSSVGNSCHSMFSQPCSELLCNSNMITKRTLQPYKLSQNGLKDMLFNFLSLVACITKLSPRFMIQATVGINVTQYMTGGYFLNFTC